MKLQWYCVDNALMCYFGGHYRLVPFLFHFTITTNNGDVNMDKILIAVAVVIVEEVARELVAWLEE
ncbi:hypothetical protein QDY71_07675 [Kingella negevensis]|uniref:Uncharacterized protein n=1 Tax=Kingella negevensis TaxID=1522312 RepID=A0A238T9L7_9NEIS|nr:hypothetical protein [Kingella negevensis]MDK4681154.1 hypothetical protein [Kingella negevensis]MDK4683357.1 hypothetical protein [Kingella negevensis]MDK4685389.1 hypothetical protein [Kingella negevensis]MDK4691513.1 hypothetical protein [Kingella negevensis]MDK4693336.1 hypothetical protein [Kingella negevensis]